MSMESKPKQNLNEISEKDLLKEFPLSPRLARRILALKPYQHIDQLDLVWGLEQKTLLAMKERFFVPIEPDVKVEIEQAMKPSPTPLRVPLSAVDPKTPFESSTSGQREMDETEPLLENKPTPILTKFKWKPFLLLALILTIGAIFRFSGLNWDDGFHQHPDERYMTMVAEQIRLVKLTDYFDTATSTLNPLNHGSYTYGMLPLFITRIVAQWLDMASYDSVTLVGRFLSSLFDLAAIWALFLLAKRLYGRKMAFIAAALAAAAVLPIQLSHFFTVDSFATVFVVLSFYAALYAIPIDKPGATSDKSNLKYYVYFGALVGLAGACKVNTLPVIAIIFLAAGIFLLLEWKKPHFWKKAGWVGLGLLLSVLSAALAFRIFQPYAFSGPNIFNVAINQRWLSVIKEVTNQVAGNSEWPPNHHWTNRPFQYAWVNMVWWGMGIPLGIAAWLGWVWAGIRMWKGDWRKHLLPFVWVLAYFVWQNMQFWRYMRYFLPIYPFLILFAAWALHEVLYRNKESLHRIRMSGRNLRVQAAHFLENWRGIASALLLFVVVVGTYLYAIGFTRIYTKPHTRVAASRWILQNIDGPLNIEYLVGDQPQSIPIPVYNKRVLESNNPAIVDIKLRESGVATQITAPHVQRLGGSLFFKVTRDIEGNDRVTDGRMILTDDEMGSELTITFGDVTLEAGKSYYFHYELENSNILSFSEVLLRNENQEEAGIFIPFEVQNQPAGFTSGKLEFSSEAPLRINHLQVKGFVQQFTPTMVDLRISILKDRNEEVPLAVSESSFNFSQPGMDLSGVFSIDPLKLDKSENYQLKYEIIQGGSVRLLAENYTLETSWDDALPLSVDRVDALGGIYSPLNLELYEPDTPQKREHLLSILEQSEYIVIPSNRAYDAMPRLELRYPLTLKYYQMLFDCNCSSDALEKRAKQLRPPFSSSLGFDLVAVFESNPGIGPLQFRDQLADESFTVYDHPKVMVFKKSDSFSIQGVRSAFEQVNLDDVVFQVPINYTKAPTALRLPEDRLDAQAAGGTWANMFDRWGIINQNEFIAIAIWYLFLLALGWVFLPLIIKLFGNLPDRGYPFARMAGLLSMAWLPWMLGSLKILPFTRLILAGCLLLFLVINIWIAARNREGLVSYVKSGWRHIIIVEVVFLLIFLFSLNVRLGNPDLWHPWLGGEKPMDFAFFNSVIKSVYFPPQNPWFSGHYLNYYYYGYVIAAIPTKLLSVVPANAFNLILPSWFAMTGIGIFGVAYNIFAGFTKRRVLPADQDRESNELPAPERRNRLFQGHGKAYFVAIFALLAAMFFGNFFEVKLLIKYLPEVAGGAGELQSENKLNAVFAGASRVLSGEEKLPGDAGRWYFAASRPILPDGPDTPIAEFPYFSFLYADLHPHLLSMPFYALPLALCLSLLMTPLHKRKWYEQVFFLLAAGMAFGLFRASHTWDFPTFIALGLLALLWTIWRESQSSLEYKIKKSLLYVIAVVVSAMLMYLPFSQWFKTEYASIEMWKGIRTPLADYLIVYGLSLFIMLSLLFSEIWTDIIAGYRRWLGIKNWRRWIAIAILGGFLFLIFQLSKMDYQVLAFGLPLVIAWIYIIFFKANLSLLNRIIWLLFAIGYGLTYIVELVVLKGDVGRMNMVFRFYSQAWFILAIAMSLALVELFERIRKWMAPFRILWLLATFILVSLSLVYPLIATGKKINDRWPGIQMPPRTIDGEAFMLGNSFVDFTASGAIYNDEGRDMDLGLDLEGIRFLQDTVEGSPVIVEGHTPEYRWGARYAIHTGLPSVIGWSWHTRQHNSLIDGSIIENRISKLVEFYNTPDIQVALDFLTRYNVEYIIVSGLERAYYSQEGLDKFLAMEQRGLLERVYGTGSPDSATIYRVTDR